MTPAKLAPVCIWLLLVLPVISQEVGGQVGGTDVNGEAESSVHRGVNQNIARATVCQHTLDAYNAAVAAEQNIYRDWTRTGSYYFSNKPQSVPSDSVCYGMNTTCCKPTAEKEILKVANKEYNVLYRETLDENLKQCPRIGRKLYSALYQSFGEIRRRFEIDMNEVLNDQLPENMFDQLFNYLNLFTFHPDLCVLEENLERQIQKISDFVYQTIQNGSDIEMERYSCFVNITTGFTNIYLQELFIALETQLYKIRILIQSVQITEEVVGVLRRHKFSPSCVNALARMKHCSYCGGFNRFKPCLYFCINTLQGCFADVAELRPSFDSLLSSLKMASNQFISQLQPETFIANSLQHFVAMTKSLKTKNLKGLMSTECISYEHSVQKRQLELPNPQVTDTNSRPVDLPEDGLSYDVFSTAMMEELACMDELNSLMWNVPQEMCFLSKNHIADIGNEQCWTGIEMGSYAEQPVGKLKLHQVNNTAFLTLPLETEILYNIEIAKLHHITKELNDTLLQEDPCLQSDDEECTTRPAYDCEFELSGSGSGSGSGFTGTSGFEDMEGEVTPSSNRPPSAIDDLNDPSLEDFDDIWLDNADNSRPYNETQYNGADSDSDDEERTKSKDSDVTIEILDYDEVSDIPDQTTEQITSSAEEMINRLTTLLIYIAAVATALAA